MTDTEEHQAMSEPECDSDDEVGPAQEEYDQDMAPQEIKILTALKEQHNFFFPIANKRKRMKELMGGTTTDKHSIKTTAILQLCAAETSLVHQILDSMGLDNQDQSKKKRLEMKHIQEAIQLNVNLHNTINKHFPSVMELQENMLYSMKPAQYENLHDQNQGNSKFETVEHKAWSKAINQMSKIV